MKIEFSGQNSPQKWIELFASQFGQTVKDNCFRLPSTLGKGFMKQFYFFEGLTLTYLYFEIFDSIEFVRQPSESSDLFPIFFYNQENSWKQNIKSETKTIGLHTENGLFMPSSQISSKWTVPSNIKDYQLTITVTKKWLISNLDKNGKSYLYNLVSSSKPFYIFESLTSEMQYIIKSIHKLIETKSPIINASLHTKTMELFTLFLEQIERRQENERTIRINQKDIEQIFKARNQILNNIPQKIPITALASECGMSVRKLQLLFIQVFGKNISQFNLTEKMNRAKEMLDSKKHSVSETGYAMGYSNLSHFTQAFKKQFGINPKQYLSK